MTHSVCIGSQLYINRGDSPDQVRTWVRQMADAGLRLIRLFILWDLTEPRKGIGILRHMMPASMPLLNVISRLCRH